MLLLNSIQVTESIFGPLCLWQCFFFTLWSFQPDAVENWLWSWDDVERRWHRSCKKFQLIWWDLTNVQESDLLLRPCQTFNFLKIKHTCLCQLGVWKFGKLAVALWKVIAILHSLTFPLLNSIGKKYLLPQSRKSTVCSWQTSTLCQLSPEKKTFAIFKLSKLSPE